MTEKNYLEALSWRYAVKEFNQEPISPEKLERIIESARLAPSSSGLEPWRLVHVTDQPVREKLVAVGYGQEKIANAAELFIITIRDQSVELAEDLVRRMAETRDLSTESLEEFKDAKISTIKRQVSSGDLLTWHRSQAYIMLGFLLYAAALEEVDACPMEGFIPEKVDEILGLESHGLKSVAMVTMGYRSPNDDLASAKKVRRDTDDFLLTI